MAETIKGINVVIGAETTGLAKALEDVNKKSKAIQSELKQVDRLLKFDPSNTELLAQKKKLLGDAIANAREKLDRLRAVQEQVNEQFRKGEISEGQYRAFQREIAKTEQDLKKFETQLKSMGPTIESFGDKLQKAGDKIGDVGKKLTDVGKNLSMKVTAPLVGLGTAVAKTGMDFEAAMSEVAAISGATGEDLAKLEALAKEMGATTKFSASEAAEGLKYMAMAGWDTQQMLEGLPGVLSLAAASGEDLGRVSDIVTDAMTAFGMQASEAAQFADILAAASSNANTNVGMLGESFKYVAPVFGSLGYSAEDAALALGLMANAGIKASQAGTALRGAITRMMKPSKDAAKLIDELGLKFTDAEGNMLPFRDVMDQLRSAFANLTAEQQAQYAATIFGQEAMSGMLAIINASEEDYQKLATAIDNSTGAADRMAKQMQDNLKGRLTELKSALEGVALQLYDHLQPALEKIVDALKKVVNWFANLSPGTQQAIVAIAAVTAAIGPLLVVLGTMAGSISAIIGVLPLLGKALAALTGPVGLVITAVTALIAIWATWGDDIKRIVSDTIEKVKTWFVNFRDNITETLSALPERLKQIGTGLVVGLWQGILDKFEWLKTRITEFGENIKSKFKEIFGISSPSKVLETYGQYLAEGLAKGLEENSSKTTRAATRMADEITLKVAAIQDAVTKTVEGISLQTQIMEEKFNLWKAKFGETASASEMFRQEMELQKAKMDEVNQKVEVLTAAYEDMKRVKGETAAETQKLYQELLKVQTAQAELQKQVEKTTQAYHAQADAIQRLLSSKNIDDVMYGATMAYIQSTGKVPSKSVGGGGLYESAVKVREQREKEQNDPHFQRNLQALLDFGMGIEEAVERLRHAERTGTQIIQNITVNSPTPLSPSETARQIKNASRQLAMEW